MGAQSIPVEQRFLAKVHHEPNSGCWLWGASLDGKGYGQFQMGTKNKQKLVRAHRVSWELEREPIPDGLHVLHKCDIRPCVNPDHLFLGTQKDNLVDMAQKGRARNQNKHATHCHRGHELSGDNVYYWQTTRQCRACKGWQGGLPQKQRTHCPYGHPYSGDNLYLRKDRPGHRECRTCRKGGVS